MESPYALIQFRNVNRHSPFPGSSKVQVSTSTFEDHRPERAEFAVIHGSTLIGAGPGIAQRIFENSKLVSHRIRFVLESY